MRVFRTILGMLLLTIGLPALLAGGALWAVMQHRDPGGAFSGELQKLTVPGYAVVVPDVDRLLRDDAPFARIGATQLRLSAATVDGHAFLGLARAADVNRYLAGVSHVRVSAVDIGTGALPVTAAQVAGPRVPGGIPGQQDFWARSGQEALSWVPDDLDDGPYSLVLMNPGGAQVGRLAAVAEVRPGWLNSTAWGLITLGTLLVMASVIVLAWPGRRREIVYVVEPSQVPDLMQAIGAPLPWLAGGTRPGGAHRPRTLADSRPSRPPALPQFSWPPNRAAEQVALPVGPAALTGGSTTGGSTIGGPAVVGGATAGGGAAVAGNAAAAGGVALATMPEVTQAGQHTPAPGKPLNLVGETPAAAGLEPGPAPARRPDRRRMPATEDVPEFQATAVGAWVAATAPERARLTEARAAARIAEAAAARKPGDGGSESGATEADAPISRPRKRVTGEQRTAEQARAESSATSADGKSGAGEKPAEVPIAGGPSGSGSTAAPGGRKSASGGKSPVVRQGGSVGKASGAGQAKPTVPGSPSAAESSESGVSPVVGESPIVAGSSVPESSAAEDAPVVGESSVPEVSSVAGVSSIGGSSVAANGVPEVTSAGMDSGKGGPGDAEAPSAAGAMSADGTSPRPVNLADVVERNRSEKNVTVKAPAAARIAVRTGPSATDWTATGLTRLDGRHSAPPPSQRTPGPGPVVAPKAPAAEQPAAVAQVPAAEQPAAVAQVPAPGQSVAVGQSQAEVSAAGQSVAVGQSQAQVPAAGRPAAAAQSQVSAVPESQAATDQPDAGAQSRAAAKPMPAAGPKSPVAAKSMPTAASKADGDAAPGADREAGSPSPAPPATAPPAGKPGDGDGDSAGSGSPASPKRPIVPFPTRPAGSPEPTEAHLDATGESVPEAAAPRVSMHATEAGPATDAPADATAIEPVSVEIATETGTGPPERASIHEAEANGLTPPTVPGQGTADRPRPGGRKLAPGTQPGSENHPLTRAQSRLSGKPAAAPAKQPAARRAPASWIKAAESMAARAADKPTAAPPQTAPPQTAPPQTAPPQTAPAETKTPTPTPAQAVAPAKALAPTQVAGPAASSAPTSAESKAQAPEKVPAQAPVPTPAQVRKPRPAGDKPHLTPTAPAVDGTEKSSSRTLSYRDEAAELLGGTSERRRRRTVAGRPTADRAKDRPDTN